MADKWLVWTWTYGSLCVEEAESLRAAVWIDEQISEEGTGARHYIETPDGEVFNDADEYDRLCEERDAALYPPTDPVPTYRIDLRDLDRKMWAIGFDWIEDRDEAISRVEDLSNRLGDGRVRLIEPKRP